MKKILSLIASFFITGGLVVNSISCSFFNNLLDYNLNKIACDYWLYALNEQVSINIYLSKIVSNSYKNILQNYSEWSVSCNNQKLEVKNIEVKNYNNSNKLAIKLLVNTNTWIVDSNITFKVSFINKQLVINDNNVKNFYYLQR